MLTIYAILYMHRQLATVMFAMRLMKRTCHTTVAESMGISEMRIV
jgi:hypothetical protein